MIALWHQWPSIKSSYSCGLFYGFLIIWSPKYIWNERIWKCSGLLNQSSFFKKSVKRIKKQKQNPLCGFYFRKFKSIVFISLIWHCRDRIETWRLYCHWAKRKCNKSAFFLIACRHNLRNKRRHWCTQKAKHQQKTKTKHTTKLFLLNESQYWFSLNYFKRKFTWEM